MRDPLERLIHLLFISKEGPTSGVEPENWSLVWRSLTQLSPTEEAQRRLAIAQADAAWIGSQVVMPEEAAVSHFGGDEFSADIHIDKELRKAMAEQPPPDEPPEPDEPPPTDAAPGTPGAPPPAGKPPAAARPPPVRAVPGPKPKDAGKPARP